MKTTKNYSPAFMESALQKVYNRGDQTIAEVAEQLNINKYTLKSWMRNHQSLKTVSQQTPPSQQWSAEQRLLALHESHGLSVEALNAWCREQGLFTHQLTQWRQAFCEPVAASSSKAEKQAIKQLQHEKQQLERELRRKEKALAEAAALLVLQKKYQALFEDEAVLPTLNNAKP